jgi:hypothetical protein
MCYGCSLEDRSVFISIGIKNSLKSASVLKSVAHKWPELCRVARSKNVDISIGITDSWKSASVPEYVAYKKTALRRVPKRKNCHNLY